MEAQLVRKVTQLERELEAVAMPETPVDLISPFLALSGLRGFWPMSAFAAFGGLLDISANARHLTYNGNPIYNYFGLAPYVDLDGTGDFLSRGDEAGLDILGTESYVAAAIRGLTFGLWARPQETSASVMVMGKANDTSGPYFLYQTATDDTQFVIRDSTDTTTYIVTLTDGWITTNIWALYVCRYTPSTEIKIWKNMETMTNTTSIPASILNGTDDFAIGAHGTGGTPWEGDASLGFLCATAVSDAQISNLFQTTRAAFGV